MEITSQLINNETVIKLSGRLDAAWSSSVDKALQDTIYAGSHKIALDLEQVSYISSAGIRVLVILIKNLKALGGTFRLINASPEVSEVLNLVGFMQLLSTLKQGTVTTNTLPNSQHEVEQLQLADNEYLVYTLHKHASQLGEVIGDSNLTGHELTMSTLPVNHDTWIIGQGCLGTSPYEKNSAGELLAVAGLAIALPGDAEQADWIQKEQELTPQVGVFHGLSVSGNFRYLLRFGETAGSLPLKLSELTKAALEICACDTVSFVALAETAHLIGAVTQLSPEQYPTDFFAFPGIRDRLLFTAEPAYANETCLIIGIISRNPAHPLASQLRPLADDSDLSIHAHAGIVPFSPIKKGYIELTESLDKFMNAQTIRGVLHLLNDDRDGVGVGESYLRRGALWCAPVKFNGESLT